MQVVPDAGFRTEAVWFVLASDPNGPKYPLRYSGSGTSWIIDQVVGDILVSASFASTAMQVRVEAEAGGSVRASYVDAAGSAVGALDVSAGAPSGGIIADLASDSDVQLTVVPDAGKLAQVSVVAKDGTKTVVPIVGTAASVTNSMLTDPQFSHIAVEFRDMVPETLSVGLSMPDLGVKVLRTDVGGAGEIAPGTTKIDDIDSEDRRGCGGCHGSRDPYGNCRRGRCGAHRTRVPGRGEHRAHHVHARGAGSARARRYRGHRYH